MEVHMNKFILTILSIVLIAGLIPYAFANGETSADTGKSANLVYGNWEEGVAYTHLVKAILEDKMGYTVTITPSDVAPAFATVAQGDSDVFMESWLPILHKNYLAKYKDGLVKIGPIYENTESGFVVPTYMADAGITKISDLLKPEAQEKLDRTITGIDAGTGMMIATEEELMPAYGLTDAGYKLLPSSGPAMTAALKRAVEKKEWIVVLGWKPHSMFAYWDLQFLKQDKKQLWGTENIYVLGRKNLQADKPELFQFFSNMYLIDSELSGLMAFIADSDKDTLEAAREWMNDNESVFADWIPRN